MQLTSYDIVVIGGGPAGYTAALYAARSGFGVLVLERLYAGGQMAESPLIENYPGFPDGIDGFTLGEKMKAGAERFGAKTQSSEVLSVDLLSTPKRILTDAGEIYAKAVIVATGARHKHLDIERESTLVGRGVGYCAACDGMLYRGKSVAVVGGGNSAVSDALYLSRVAKRVYLIHRRDTLRATRVYSEPLRAADNIEILWNTEVKALLGEDRLAGVLLKNTDADALRELPLDGLFISIGRAPESAPFEGQLNLSADGYIVADESMKTSVEGVYAAGDVRTKSFRQIVTAISDGAMAAYAAEEHLLRSK